MRDDVFPPLPACLNGTADPVPPAEPEEAWHKIEHAYQELQRRDSTAEERAAVWQRMAAGLLVLLAGTLGVCLYLVVTAREVQTVVQVVQQEANGQLVQVGVPLDLLAYTPADGQWMDMLREWVQKRRWKSGETPVMHAHWAWVYRHTCPMARRVLQHEEAQEKPFDPQQKLVTVVVTSLLKTATPQSYQVLFTERSTEQTKPQVEEQTWTATLAVGRMRPATLADALANRLGLCVSGFAFEPVSGK